MLNGHEQENPEQSGNADAPRILTMKISTNLFLPKGTRNFLKIKSSNRQCSMKTSMNLGKKRKLKNIVFTFLAMRILPLKFLKKELVKYS
jgi:hypothetical protein